MPVLRIGILVLVLVASGCCPCGCLVKRDEELSCPTDIRQTVPWCVGEDAIFHCPCGPDRSYYGYKPTCWGIWPTAATEWRDSRCGPGMTNCGGEETGYPPTELPTPVPDEAEEIPPGMPPAREMLPQGDSDGTLPVWPFPETSSGGRWPAEQTSGTLTPQAAAYVRNLPANSLPTKVAFDRTGEDQSRQQQQIDHQPETLGDAPLLPNRLIVFQQPAQSQAATQDDQLRREDQSRQQQRIDQQLEKLSGTPLRPDRMTEFQQPTQSPAATQQDQLPEVEFMP